MNVRGVSIYKPKSRGKKTDPYLLAYGLKGSRKVITGPRDKNIAVELATKIAKTLERAKHGLATQDDVRYEIQATRSIGEHLAEYEAAVIHEGRTPKHAKQMREYAEKIMNGAGVRYIGDMVPSLLQREVALIEDGNATKNRHIAAVRRFLTWGFGDVRWPESVPMSVRLTKFASEVERNRRVLNEVELGSLIFAAETGGAVEKLDGSTRSLIYRLALASGLRANEIRTRKVSDIRNTGVFVQWGKSKNRKSALIGLPAPLIAEVRAYAAARARNPEEFVFDISDNPHRLIQADLKAAGIDYETAEGVFDFHALRHQCGAMLASSGLPVKSVQVHMRHASIRMTLDVYGHLFDRDADKTVEMIGKIGQRLAQRNRVGESGRELPSVAAYPLKTGENQWSDGESNPDLLNAIQQRDQSIYLINGRLHDVSGSPLAPGAAQGRLRRAFHNVNRRFKRRRS